MIVIKRLKNSDPKVYYNFTVIEIEYINSIQIIALNITILGILIKIFKFKKKNKYD